MTKLSQRTDQSCITTSGCLLHFNASSSILCILSTARPCMMMMTALRGKGENATTRWGTLESTVERNFIIAFLLCVSACWLGGCVDSAVFMGDYSIFHFRGTCYKCWSWIQHAFCGINRGWFRGIWCYHSYLHADIQAIVTYHGIHYVLEVMTGAKDREAGYFQHLSLCREIDYTQRVGYALKQCRQY